MSTPAAYAQAPSPAHPVSGPPSTSTALVPVAADRRPRPAEKAVNAHRAFYAMGYTGLVMIWASAWLGGLVGQGADVLGIPGGLMVGLGGFGILIHTLWKPNERKVRHLLLAIASLAVTIAAFPLVLRITREMYATAAVTRLQPLAQALAKDARIREIGVLHDRALLNGYWGPEQGPGGSIEGASGEYPLKEVLARDGISRQEYGAYRGQLERLGMQRAQRTASAVAFAPADHYGFWLLYVAPGHALPPAHELLNDSGSYYSEPLGGSWYMVRNGRR